MLGVGSNILVRDGGVEGVVIRLAAGPSPAIEPRGRHRIYRRRRRRWTPCWRARPAKAGIAGLEFYAGIPGTIGGALTMNAGCYGAETKDVLVVGLGLDRAGERRRRYALRRPRLHLSPQRRRRRTIIWIEAVFEGRPDDPAAVAARMDEITARRETTQPIREKTGGSTFKNPPGHSSWKLVDEAGWRGKPFGGAMFSPLHANFLINTGEATAADLEGLGEAVRADVQGQDSASSWTGRSSGSAARPEAQPAGSPASSHESPLPARQCKRRANLTAA